MRKTPGASEAFPRSSGILLHPTCLPGGHGIGDLGATAYRFVDWLEAAGQSVWQILPLGPTSYGDSPYQTLSAFAGNPLLISLDDLLDQGWLVSADLAELPELPADRVDFGAVMTVKDRALATAHARFVATASTSQKDEFIAWCVDHAYWLDDFALFMAIKTERGGEAWTRWPRPLALRAPDSLAATTVNLGTEIQAQKFRQWIFFAQWARLRAYASARGIRFFGDLPIFVAHDSSDVWTWREFFQLDAKGKPKVVAGVPPDYFSATGQLWGNPLYDWERLRADDYAWWVARLRAALELVDIVRIDHFRGFEAYWEVAADASTAVKGRWVPGPGAELFEVLRAELGRLPIVAEDLGVITPAVEALRDRFELPGMKVLQFAWSDPENPFLPHAHRRNCVVYVGTHDNDPTRSWWQHAVDDGSRHFITEYLDGEPSEPHWAFIRLGMMSVAHTFVATMPDVLGLGRESRMNAPGESRGNWTWRLPATALKDPAQQRLARLTWLYRRRPDQAASPAEFSDGA